MKRATYYAATLMLCGGIIIPTAAAAPSLPPSAQPTLATGAAPTAPAPQNPYQVPKPFEVGILKWSQDVYSAGRTSDQEAQRCAATTPTPIIPAQLGQANNQTTQNCSTREIGFVEFIAASLVHFVVKVTKPVPGYQGITPAPAPAPVNVNGEINLSHANTLPRN